MLKRFLSLALAVLMTLSLCSCDFRSLSGGQKSRILDVMERTMAGERIFPDETPLIRIGNATNHEFTERELDVLKELTTGDTNAEIAGRLFISVATVKSHILHLMEKTGFKTRTELVSEARGLGIVIKDTKPE